MHILTVTNQPNIYRSSFNAGDKKELSRAENAENKNNTALQQNADPKQYKNGSSIAVAALAMVCCFFMLSKGFQKSANVFLNKTKEYFEKKSAHSLKESGKRKKFYDFSIRRINSFIIKSQSINNITSLKDILFMKLMYKTQMTKDIHQSISNYFQNISQKTVLNSYEKTKKSFEQMNKAFDELDDYILKNSADELVEFEGKQCTKRELIEKARAKRDLSNTIVNAFIDKTTIQNRYKLINNYTSSLYSTFWDASFKDFWSKDNKFKQREMWQTFIAAEQIQGTKSQFATWSSYARNAISYTNNDQTNNVYEYIKALDNIIPSKDKEGAEIVKRLEWFVKNPEVFQNNKELFFKELNKLKEHQFLLIKNEKILQALNDYKNKNIYLIEMQINDNRPGILQEMLTYYYKIAPYELDKSGALLSLRRAVKSFDESMELEGVEFFDKVRDLRLGSAPTDVLTILLSFITLSLGLGHAKDKNQRTSVMLKSGIPIVGGIATAMFSTAKLVSGGKSLALGLLSGIILNRLGKIADNVRQNKKIKPRDVIEVKPIQL